MADEGGGWDDLFAAAAGDESHAHYVTTATGTKRPANQSTADDSETNHTHTRREKKAKKKARKSQKNKPGRHRSDDSADQFAQMLESRMDISKEATRHWPAWVRPGGSLLDGSSSSTSVSCQGYAGPYDASEDGNYDPKKKRKCSKCGKSPLYHALVMNSAGTGMPNTTADGTSEHLKIFLSNRNIRVCASLALASSSANSSGRVKACAKSALRNTNKLSSRIRSLTSRLASAGEASILEEKFGALHRAVKAWKSGCDGTSSSVDFDTMVRVMIASDAVYFRLYYLQLTASLPILDAGLHIPHPTTYFVADMFSFDTVAGSRCARKLLKRDDCGGTIAEVVQQYSSLSGSSDHPLTVLKSSRFRETLLLFGDWSQDPQTKRDFARAVKAAEASNARLQSTGNLSEDAFYDMHECPAPQILMDWRDVCRDHNCNLYAYATLGPNSIDDIKSVCSSVGVFEAGAGTGYYASLLQAAGIDVKPSDIASTDASINEYHGSTPSFTDVENGGIDKLKSDLRQFHHKSLPLPALLLCYPPPLSEMAHDALRVFIGAGGKQLIHIGEFQGLTGSPTFEWLLLRNFRCVQRAPCLGWGTDASAVTVWESCTTTKSSTNAAQILIPCSNCKFKPSSHRFRLIRSLTYCSETCYLAHVPTRSAHAVCNMIPLETVKEASFGDETHMMRLKGTNAR